MSLLPILALSAALTASADTLTIESAAATEPLRFRAPYQTDSLNHQGKAFDLQKVMDENVNLIVCDGSFSRTAHAGEALEVPTADGESVLCAYRFSLNADRFTKLSLSVPNLSTHKTFVDRRPAADGDIQLAPGRSEVTVVCQTKRTSTDTFRISVVGDTLAGLTVGTNGKRPYTVRLMNEGDHYRSASLSPSGAYLLTSYYFTRSDGKNEYRTTLTDMKSQRVTMRWSGNQNMRWQRTADVLYFTRAAAEENQMVTFNPRTLEEKVIASHIPEGHFTLSPKGDYAIFSRTQEGRTELTPNLKRLDDPDDRMDGWRSRNVLYRYDFATHQMQPLTFGTVSVYLSDISPDASRLLLAFDRMDPSRHPFDRRTLVEMNAYTGQVDTLLADTSFISSAVYSPDGRQLLIKASPLAFGGIGNEVPEDATPNFFDNRLYVYDIASRTARPLLPNFSPSVDDFLWAEGDGQIYFRADDAYDVGLFRLNPTSLKCERIQFPITYIQQFSIARQQKRPLAVVFGQTATRARDMYVATLSSASPASRRIGEIDFDSLYADVAFGECRTWNFRSSQGDTIRGFYVLPPNFDATKQYPVIVYYYGGCTPTPRELEFLPYPFQVLAGQGYVVYVVEPSGAIGFGQEFAARHVNTWGIRTADDIIEGTRQFLAEHPWANAKKVGCLGASYGGFMTQYLQTRTDLFAAAISHAGISNIASYWGGGYWGYTYGEAAQYGSYPWNNPDLYVKQSPLFNADKIHTPLLLLHGTADTNVPTTESQQLFTALRILGRPVSYVQVKDENHYIADYTKRQAWQNTIFAWFAHWLKDEPLWWRTLYPGDDFGVKK